MQVAYTLSIADADGIERALKLDVDVEHDLVRVSTSRRAKPLVLDVGELRELEGVLGKILGEDLRA